MGSSVAASTAYLPSLAGGSVAIANADSAEQLQETLASTPLFLFSEFEVRPLTDYAKYMDSVAAAFEKQGR
jgi:muconolactone delta-isomerase